jgi:hypothetical protein
MYDEADFGTWSESSSERETQRAYTVAQTAYTLTSAEPAGDDGSGYTFDGARALADMQTHHFTACAMNQSDAVSAGVYDAWKASGHYATMAKRMGYRFRMTSAHVPDTLSPGGTLTLRVTMTNDGFARPVNPRLIEIVLKQTPNAAVTRFSITPPDGQDARLFLPGPGETKELTLSASLPSDQPLGEYQIYLNFPDPTVRLKTRPEYSIRLANEGVWEGSTGLNRIGGGLRVVTP